MQSFLFGKQCFWKILIVPCRQFAVRPNRPIKNISKVISPDPQVLTVQRIRMTNKDGTGEFVTANDISDIPLWRQRITGMAGRIFGFNSKQTTAIKDANLLYGAVSLPVESYPSFFDLPNTVQSWFSITHLHVYLISVRLRAEGDQGHRIINSLVNCFIDELEDRIRRVGITSNSIVGKSLKEFLSQLYGRTLAYDEGITGTDVELASALWRNYFALDPNVSLFSLEKYVRYMREQLYHLDHIPSNLILSGQVSWSSKLLANHSL